ncbi:TerC family protein [Aquibacillus koreensis]|uniref:TerC family protein n=1 Tax=Aquibacillus koreensis TaxID=279446 RepID=A0A9X3WM37_9BACI|nr:TerC family protein [Aquibacillus koreensis]MCT2534185.1 TerC family protein [Aquibacillus koreensis]MDC3422577.1 TerC family protein [Aquibacillus koreensis]
MDFYTPLLSEVSSGAIIALLKIIAIDIILSGDNAVVIAMATKNLPKHQQNKAILLGTAGAIILRIFFALIVIFLLKIPFVHAIGGLLLLWIAYNVLVEEEENTTIKSHSGLLRAISTIIVADAVMSLDNVVAISGAAHGDMKMIAMGVLISIPIMIFGSKMIVKAMDKFRWIAYVGSGILAWTAGEMILDDVKIKGFLNLSHGPITYIIATILMVAVLLSGYIKNKEQEYQ